MASVTTPGGPIQGRKLSIESLFIRDDSPEADARTLAEAERMMFCRECNATIHKTVRYDEPDGSAVVRAQPCGHTLWKSARGWVTVPTT